MVTILGFLDIETLMLKARYMNSTSLQSAPLVILDRLIDQNKKLCVKLWFLASDQTSFRSLDHVEETTISLALKGEESANDDHTGAKFQTKNALIEEAIQDCQNYFNPKLTKPEFLCGEGNKDLNVDLVRQQIATEGKLVMGNQLLTPGFIIEKLSVSHIQQQPTITSTAPDALPLNLRNSAGCHFCLTGNNRLLLGQYTGSEDLHFLPVTIRDVKQDLDRKRRQLFSMERCLWACLRLTTTAGPMVRSKYESKNWIRAWRGSEPRRGQECLEFSVRNNEKRYILQYRVDRFKSSTRPKNLPETAEKWHGMEFAA